jgi:NADPH2:quinone reductase
MKNPDEHAALETELFALAARGDLRPVEPTIAPLADAGRVLSDISQRRIVGKVVLAP